MGSLILASASPRRKEILKGAGYDFEIVTSDKEGEIDDFSSPCKIAVRCAVNKCEDVYSRCAKNTGKTVLSADTVVSLNGKIFGKPKDRKDAERILKTLSGNVHEVITGYCFIKDKMRESGYVVTKVKFNSLKNEEIEKYLNSNLWQGKAGAYGIQDGYNLIESYDGDYDNVVGLPIKVIEETLKEFLK